jgi:hypothetical protein
MTADIRYLEMIAITVRNVSVIIVRAVAHTARFVILRFAWDAVLNVPLAISPFANTVRRCVRNVMQRFVLIVLMMKVYVITAKSRERNKKMKKKQQQMPSLRFTPTAWAKLVYLRDITDNEVGGFGIADADDLLLVTDFALVKQKVTAISVSFDDEAVADFFEDQVEAGRRPEQFARIWLHTHPGNSPSPSFTDESTFERVFGSCDWSIMAIVAQEGSTFARLRFNAGPGGEVKIPVSVDYSIEFDAAEFEVWEQQYVANVTEDVVFSLNGKSKKSRNDQFEDVDVFGSTGFDSLGVSCSEDLIEELEMMQPGERQAFMNELAVRSDFWDEYESEVLYE